MGEFKMSDLIIDKKRDNKNNIEFYIALSRNNKNQIISSIRSLFTFNNHT
jgi:hypothetical protein